MDYTPDFAISSQRVVTPEGENPATILIKGEKILDVVGYQNIPEGCHTEDLGNDVVMPGLVDAHVHINEPGRTDWEGFETATKAAASGGITTLVDMPLNCIPVTTTVDALHQKISSTRNKLYVDCGFYGGLIPECINEIEPLAEAGVLGFKTFMSHSGIHEFPKKSEKDLENALPLLAQQGIPLLAHAELESCIQTEKDPYTYNGYLATRPKSWENNAIKLLIKLCRKFQTPVHIVHLSSADILPEIAQARSEGLPLSVESCPHYLHLTAENISDGDTRFKCAPPIREAENRLKLWQGLQSGIIDFITSDHSPCTPELKKLSEGNFNHAWGGISSLQLNLSIIWTECRSRGFSRSHLSNWMSLAPAKFIGMDHQKGQISPGCDADLICWDPDASFIVKPSMINFKNKLTPYEDEKLFGVVKKTFLRGEKVYENGKFIKAPFGKTLMRKNGN